MIRKISWKKWTDVLSNDEDEKQIFMHTPLGLVSHKLREGANGSLNFWLGQTNFDIDNEVYNKILNSPGVEILTPLTPYSFRISIGNMFNEKRVMNSIADTLGCNKKKNINLKNKSEILKIKKEISLKNHWCIYVLPNGNFEHFSTDSYEEFVEPIAFFTNLKKDIGGVLLSSNGV